MYENVAINNVVKSHPSGFKIIDGGRRDTVTLHGRAIHLVSERPDRVAFDLIVIEDDVFRVFSAPTQLEVKAQHPVQVMTGLLYAEPLKLGTIKLTKQALPKVAAAIVYDSNLEHITTAECLQDSWRKLWELSRQLKTKSLYVPLLGAMHSSLPTEILLEAFISHLPADGTEEIWLQISEEMSVLLGQILEAS